MIVPPFPCDFDGYLTSYLRIYRKEETTKGGVHSSYRHIDCLNITTENYPCILWIHFFWYASDYLKVETTACA
ncbi:hypothetical protein AHAS_Ahas06G0124000 [Arachis hypogaea]